MEQRTTRKVEIEMEINTSFPLYIQQQRIREALEGLFFDVKIISISNEPVVK